MVYAYFLHSSSSSWIEQKTKNQKTKEFLFLYYTLSRGYLQKLFLEGRKECDICNNGHLISTET
jgi:hypothetical protein